MSLCEAGMEYGHSGEGFVTEDEREIFEGGLPAVPFLMEEYKGAFTFEVYSGFEDSAAKFASRFKGKDRFSPPALASICAEADEYLSEYGYVRDKKATSDFYIRYEADSRGRIDSSRVLGSTHFLRDIYSPGDPLFMKKAGNRTTFNLKALVKKGLPAYITVEDGCVVSIATVNETMEERNLLEITVETAVGFRRNGFAISNTAALALDIMGAGKKAVYCCRTLNTASNEVAKRCGLEEAGRFFAISAYKM